MSLKASDMPLAYDRSVIRPGIMHFGVGQFCRGHLFRYTQKILELSAKEQHQYDNWGIIGVNTLAGEREKAMWEDFKSQDCMYTLSLFPSKGTPTHEMMGSMLNYLYAPEDSSRVLDFLSNPDIKVVSMTVTEGGYNIDEKTNTFDLTNKAVKEDLKHPQRPSTVFGYIVEGLRLRRSKGIKAFTVMSCDNLRHNGDVAKKAILGFAKARDRSLATWIESHVNFPNSMVDRITPATTPTMRDMLNRLTGLNDRQPVIGEDFAQWVLEDKFNDGARPPWERVGLELSNNVPGYENTKVRILNSSHLMITFPGLLLGYLTVHEALADPDIYRLVKNSLDENILPTLQSPMNKEAYRDKVLSRFMNAAIADQLLRIAGDGCSKVQVFWTNNVHAVIENDMDLSNFAFGLACFVEYLYGKDCNGKSFPVIEPKLTAGWEKVIQSSDLAAPLQFNVFDSWRSLNHAKLDAEIVRFRKLIRTKGVRAAMPFRQRSKL